MFEDTKKKSADRAVVVGTAAVLGLATLVGIAGVRRTQQEVTTLDFRSIAKVFEKEGLDPMSIRLDSRNEIKVDPDRHFFKLRPGTDQAKAEVFLIEVGYTDVKSAGAGAAVILDCGVTDRVLESIRRGGIKAE